MTDGDSGDDSPDPPQSIPAYITDSLQRQDVHTLRRVAAYGEQLTGLTPSETLMTDDFDPDDLKAGDVVRHSSNKSTIEAQTGQIARVLGEEAVEIWDASGSIQTIYKDDITAVSTAAADQSIISRLRDTPGTDDETDAGE